MSISEAARASSKNHLLMVDDNRMGLGARKAVMEELGFHVVPASSPAEALELLGKVTVDLVITDYRMPGMNGADFIREMKKRGMQSPVIIISGFVDALGLTEANTGADVVIQKSANEVTHMVHSVKRLLTRPISRKPSGTERSAAPRRKKKA